MVKEEMEMRTQKEIIATVFRETILLRIEKIKEKKQEENMTAILREEIPIIISVIVELTGWK